MATNTTNLQSNRTKVWPLGFASQFDTVGVGAVIGAFYAPFASVPDTANYGAGFTAILPYDIISTTITVRVAISSSNGGQLKINTYANAIADGVAMAWNIEAGTARTLTPTGIDYRNFLVYTLTHATIIGGAAFGIGLLRDASDANTGIFRAGPASIEYVSDS